jgi:triacylglycerol lipase
MALLGLVRSSETTAVTVPTTAPSLQLEFAEVLACGRRLWLRGRLLNTPPPPAAVTTDPHWWFAWPHKSPATPVLAHLETRISGRVFEADLPLQADGRFETCLEADLPPARRGWRLARNRVQFARQTTEKCALVALPAVKAKAAVAVLLPVRYTLESGEPCQWSQAKAALRLTPLLRRLQGSTDAPSFYYVAAVPSAGAPSQAELALALATLGWPTGSYVVVPTAAGQASEALAHALDRLRWLLAGTLPLSVVNLEPSLTRTLVAPGEPGSERAPLRVLLQPTDDPATVAVEGLATAPAPLVTFPRRTRSALVPRYPVVFCHGLLAYTTFNLAVPEDVNYFSHMRRFLRERGFRALYPQVTPTGGVAIRAAQLKEQILRWTDEPVNLVGHSMGGLDARYLISRLGLAERVRTLTTVSTPHRGSALVDWFVSSFREGVPLLQAMQAAGLNVDGFEDCRPGACRDFNACTPDMPGVRYFSYGGAAVGARVTPFLRRAWAILKAAEGPNDGMVSAASARWGEYLGTLNADHFAQTPDLAFVHPQENFDPVGFYVRLLEDLARRGY